MSFAEPLCFAEDPEFPDEDPFPVVQPQSGKVPSITTRKAAPNMKFFPAFLFLLFTLSFLPGVLFLPGVQQIPGRPHDFADACCPARRTQYGHGRACFHAAAMAISVTFYVMMLGPKGLLTPNDATIHASMIGP